MNWKKRNRIFAQSQSNSSLQNTNYNNKNTVESLTDTNLIKWLMLTSLVWMGSNHIMLHLIGCTSLSYFCQNYTPWIWSLGINYQIKLKYIQLNNWPIIFKCEVHKSQGKAGKLFQTEKDKRDIKVNKKWDYGMDPFAKRTLLNGVWD